MISSPLPLVRLPSCLLALARLVGVLLRHTPAASCVAAVWTGAVWAYGLSSCFGPPLALVRGILPLLLLSEPWVPGFLATSFDENVAREFLFRAAEHSPEQIMWVVHVDPDGETVPPTLD
eukprot:COSAG02_NODE_2607_length_8436_cov_3.451841_4_plen_120_part_00